MSDKDNDPIATATLKAFLETAAERNRLRMALAIITNILYPSPDELHQYIYRIADNALRGEEKI